MPPALYLSILPTLTFCLPDNNPLQIRKKMGESSHSLTLTLHSLQSQDDYNNGSNPGVIKEMRKTFPMKNDRREELYIKMWKNSML